PPSPLPSFPTRRSSDLLGSLAIHDKFLIYLGIAMLIGVPAAYKLARIALDLRRSGLPPVSPDSQTVPPHVAQTIIAKVRGAFPKDRKSTRLNSSHVAI